MAHANATPGTWELSLPYPPHALAGDGHHVSSVCRQQLRMVALLDNAKTHAVARVRRFAAHLRKQVACMFTFARVSGIEPTSNPTERMLRCAVLWRKGSFASHSEEGCRFVSCFLTISRSLRLQRRDVMEFLVDALDAHASARSPPQILPATG